ncbi:hypothetical protein JTE90_027082 [Oedothorax gibbosus]|uniref:Methionine synthase reductase n=1 Tax=Oedothorax gibbosus TaxID=931172 RepID=A0AAV6U8E6_9ARAC|nr:hypothetical protein JTE90_027082 [Oedothorax gibbosus]
MIPADPNTAIYREDGTRYIHISPSPLRYSVVVMNYILPYMDYNTTLTVCASEDEYIPVEPVEVEFRLVQEDPRLFALNFFYFDLDLISMSIQQGNDLKRFLLLYSSQTGQAKAIAEEIAHAAPLHGLKADLQCLSLTDKRFCIENETCAVFVVSTTGDGEPPDSAIKFYRRISRHTLKANFLEKLQYALLALGDSNYIKFCLFGRLLDRRLQALSAKPFYERGYGDDAFGIETGVDPWILNLWPALQRQLHVKCEPMNGPLTNGNCIDTEDSRFNMSTLNKEAEVTSISELSTFLKDVDVEKCRLPKLPAPTLKINFEDDHEPRTNYVPNESLLNSQASSISNVKVVSCKRLTYGDDVKTTLELKLQFQDSPIPYKPGDSYGFICPNPADEVELLLQRLNVPHLSESVVRLSIPDECAGKRKIPAHIPPFLTLRDIFLHCVEIRSVPKKILFRILAEYTSDEEEKKSLLYLSSPEGSKAYTNCVRKPSLSILDILLHYKSCNPPAEKLLEYLPCLRPRFYSVASSPLNESDGFTVVFNVLKFETSEGRTTSREGVCTGWFKKLSSQFQRSVDDVSSLTNQMSALNIDCDKPIISIYKRTNPYFYLPENLDCPIIMVGPGTGVAPFIGFLQHREKLLEMHKDEKKFGTTWLFYGCRYQDKDFLYKSELQRLQSSEVLSHLVVSLSRETVLPPNVTTRYVHESIKENADALTRDIEAGGRIYVCGDAKHMAQDVQQAFIQTFQMSLDLSPNDAKTYVEKLQLNHLYINDVWA